MRPPLLCILKFMQINTATYKPISTVVHSVDARVKIVLLIAYSVMLFCIGTWPGILMAALLLAVCMLASRMDVVQTIHQLLPLGVILAFALVSNSISFDAAGHVSVVGNTGSFGLAHAFQPIRIVGPAFFVPEGFARGIFNVLRIVLLVFASFVLTTTTSSTQLARSFEQLLRPLERVKFPSRDVATIVSIALRFIPITIDEFHSIKAAQIMRGASFDEGNLFVRVKAYGSLLIPLFVGLFRKADNLATAMDARCYGLIRPTCLHNEKCSRVSICILLAGLALIVLLAILG